MTARAAPLLAGLLILAQPRAQELTLDEVMVNVAAYVAEFEQQLSAIVSEETYTQRVTNYVPGTNNLSGRQVRTLKSDLLLLRPDGTDRWVQFRDVFDVDGRPVRDRAERLTRMFLQGDSADDQIRSIIHERARYNIGDIQRTINVPLLPLVALEGERQRGYRFRRLEGPPAAPSGRDRSLPDSPTFSVSTEVWVIEYDERARPTLIQQTDGSDLPTRGRFWIDPSSGKVLMSELITEGRNVQAQINVSYQSDPLLGLLVPVEMRERYSSGSRGILVEGTATYARFRKFQVKTDEEIAVPRE